MHKDLTEKALRWASLYFDTSCLLNSNHHDSLKYGRFHLLLAAGADSQIFNDGRDAFMQLKQFADANRDWLFGYFSYDLKNQVENLQSANYDGLAVPDMHFFRPIVVVRLVYDRLIIECRPGHGDHSDPDRVFNAILQQDVPADTYPQAFNIRARVSRNAYIDHVHAIKEHIHHGDIYEMNYCVEFFDDRATLDPLQTYNRLNGISPTPFSVFYKQGSLQLLCGSPERFLCKRGQTIISQPIKGTIGRGIDSQADMVNKQTLLNDPKERSENVMIVDLVRNDLSKTAKDGSVRVEELFGIYSFAHVHQMISTVVSEISDGTHFVDVIRHAFPMGSMTGAPKVRAMQLIEEHEDTKRGLYSGAVGYISPERDFDFNVVIRSILYNADRKYLSFMAGSAITAGSVPEKEYDECLLKAASMRKALGSDELGMKN